MSNVYPIFIKLTNKKCVVIGGGKVAYQKIKSLLTFGANIIAISPDFCKDILQLTKERKIVIIKREFTAEDLKDAFLVVAATNSDEINKNVFKEAHKNKALCNVVDNPDLSDFYFPSISNFGNLTIAISTNGKSPALSKKIKSEINSLYGRYMADVVSILEGFRTKLKTKIKSVNRRREILNNILNEITFFGRPENGKEVLETLNKEIKRWL